MAQRGNSNIYKQLINNDLVKELDDIEAISQQISQHAEVLYQSWKNNQEKSNGQVREPVDHPKEVNGNSHSEEDSGVAGSTSSLTSPSRIAAMTSKGSTIPRVTTGRSAASSSSEGGKSMELLAEPEMNGNLKDLVNSFVSTDRAKQAARLTIANTINNHRRSIASGFRSPSLSTSSSPFSSRAVSPLRSPTLASALPSSVGPLSPSQSSTSSTNSSLDKPNDGSDLHPKLSPMFKTSKPCSGYGSDSIPIPVLHVKISNNEDGLTSPGVLKKLQPPTTTTRSNIRNLHDAHVESMKQKFEETKQRMNLMQRRIIDQPFDGVDGGEDPNSGHGFLLLDQLRRRGARTKRETPSAPHPELTPQQRQHIHERAAPSNSMLASSQPMVRRFANGGSVAERVMIFERCPIFGSDSKELQRVAGGGGGGGGGSACTGAEKAKEPNWRINVPSDAASNRLSRPIGGNLSLGRSTGGPKVVREVPIATVVCHSTSEARSTSPVASAAAKSNVTAASKVQPSEAEIHSFKPLHQPAVEDFSPSSSASPPLAKPSSPVAKGSASQSKPNGTLTSSSSSPSPRQASTLNRGREKVLPRFHFPNGNPSALNPYSDGNMERFEEEFRKHENASVTMDQFGKIMKKLGYASAWKSMVFSLCVGRVITAHSSSSGGEETKKDEAAEPARLLCLSKFAEFWHRMVSSHHDEASQFVYVVTRAADLSTDGKPFGSSLAAKSQKHRSHIVPEDLIMMIQDVVDSHPGLGFLKEATEFHSRYVHTVIARIFYAVNRSWSGLLTAGELGKSNFLSTLRLLDEEEDINAITDFFSYEHFYVIYCKFWELDTDHDLFIDREDLSRHNDHAISTRMVDRIFSGTVTRGAAQQEGKMSYTEFVWFLLAEEDKRHPTSVEYWFRCMDLDGDGLLSMYELEYFYEEQLQRMEQLGIETLPFEDCLCQMLDMIGPKYPNAISLSDLRGCPMTPIFFDTFFNLEKYLDHEQRDPFASQRDVDEDGNELSDWDRFAAEEYELLVAEEGNADAVMDELCYDDDGEAGNQDPELLMEQALDNEAACRDHQIT